MCTLISIPNLVFLFFFNDTATTEIYTLSLHDALPILPGAAARRREDRSARRAAAAGEREGADGPEPTAVDGVARAAGRAGPPARAGPGHQPRRRGRAGRALGKSGGSGPGADVRRRVSAGPGGPVWGGATGLSGSPPSVPHPRAGGRRPLFHR